MNGSKQHDGRDDRQTLGISRALIYRHPTHARA
jgi:hypothetical protein